MQVEQKSPYNSHFAAIIILALGKSIWQWNPEEKKQYILYQKTRFVALHGKITRPPVVCLVKLQVVVIVSWCFEPS